MKTVEQTNETQQGDQPGLEVARPPRQARSRQIRYPAPIPSVSRPPEMSSSVTSPGTGWRKFGEATRKPSRIVDVDRAAAVNVGMARLNHGPSAKDRQAKWSYVHAWVKPNSSTRCQIPRACAHGYSGQDDDAQLHN